MGRHAGVRGRRENRLRPSVRSPHLRSVWSPFVLASHGTCRGRPAAVRGAIVTNSFVRVPGRYACPDRKNRTCRSNGRGYSVLHPRWYVACTWCRSVGRARALLGANLIGSHRPTAKAIHAVDTRLKRRPRPRLRPSPCRRTARGRWKPCRCCPLHSSRPRPRPRPSGLPCPSSPAWSSSRTSQRPTR